MIFGSIDIKPGMLHTNNDSYALKQITTVSVRRPFLAPGLMISALFVAFGASFHDLLYSTELIVGGMIVAHATALGFWLGQLQLLSRDLRGSQLSAAIWGSYSHLNKIRKDVANAMYSGTGGSNK